MNEEEMNELTEFYELLKIAERISEGDWITQISCGGLGRSCGYIRDSRMYLDEDDLPPIYSDDMYSDAFDNSINQKLYDMRRW
tara:strand:- start:21 stop:269 length:249 start_codon:yes stop_codon:yes gene_type:complete